MAMTLEVLGFTWRVNFSKSIPFRAWDVVLSSVQAQRSQTLIHWLILASF